MAASNNEALQTLFHSFAGEGSQNVTPETVERLSNQLSQLLGEDVVRDAFANGGRGAERFNEEGLPVVDINEPGGSAPVPTNQPILNEPDLIPLSSLSPGERERRRTERDRILDLLEEEEEMEQRREEEREKQEKQEAAEKRKEAAKLEMERLKMVRETQKKMGKALLKGLSDDKEGESSQKKTDTKMDSESGKDAKKSVSFAAESVSDGTQVGSEKVDWGDVAIGRLRAAKQLPSLLSQNLQNEQLMKTSVVERIPGIGKVNSVLSKTEQADSDDESDAGGDEDSDGSADLEEEEIDTDFAQQQREVALEYHRKRGKIGEAVGTAFTSHSHTPDEDPSAEPPASKTKPPMSAFRASKLASSYATSAPSSSQSLGGSILPASGAETLQRSIRMGKLDSDNKLVAGGDGESDSEREDEATQEMLELLQKGEVYNVGPNGDIPASSKKPGRPADTRTSQPFTPPTQPLPSKPKTSQFKLSRSQDRPTSDVDPSAGSRTATPISHVERSSPKLPSSVVERTVSERSTPVSPDPDPSLAPIIIESPSFQRPPDFSRSMVVESPSFPQNPTRSSSRPDRPPVIMSANVRESVPKSNSGVDNSEGDDEEANGRPPKKVSRFKAERM
ncbi:hypothetical protein K435DRAFT_869899 [Dendrothele bispora CBS 962.96]|uniref:DUF3835 domain-containing protein n=1 Tax=Dendrothele bispora (strain CBS 962.96) TaxID=1314807 RepID=A0A4S8L7W5_DENBC|nr:hypothetical protein K435DRAFT_869899 [Dendrothele bispora CBS 962.96]